MSDIDPNTAADFFALVLLVGAVLLAAALTRPAARAALAADAVRLSALVAAGATGGSLYFSEVANFQPCQLCWFQRIAMYPIAVIGVLATVRRDRAVLPYLGALAGIGGAVSLYHIYIQAYPERSSVCDASVPCSSRLVEGLGWMTIPQMAAVSFAVIITLTVLGTRVDRKASR
ncbi:MAG: disulfide bond formation protein B [Acidimicrobiales bacterium]